MNHRNLMKVPTLLPRALACALLPLGLLAPARSQTAAAAPAAEATAAKSDVEVLSPFTVNGTTTNGYIASESVTGTRVATKIKDLPFNVEVITNEFMNDFAMFEINDNLGYTSTLNNFDQGGGYNLRGFAATNMLRNGFFRLGLVDKINVDRIEVIKGPSAALYGQTTPGGLLNVITKQPRTTPQQRVTFYFGSYGTDREEISSTGPISSAPDPKTFYMANAAFYERTYGTPYSALRSKTASFSVKHNFSDTSNLLVEFEYLRRQADSSPQGAPYNALTGVVNPYAAPPAPGKKPATYTEYTGTATSLANFNPNGPKSWLSREISDLNVTYENRLNEVFSLRTAANWYHRHYWLFNNTGINYYDVTKGTENRGTPTWGLIGEDGGGFQADLLAHWYLFNGKVENKTLATVDYSTYWRFDPQLQISNSNLYAKNQSITAPDYTMPDFSPVIFNSVNRWDKNRTDVFGTLVRQQTAAFHGRLIAYAGIRFDTVVFNLWEKDKNTTAGYVAGGPTTGVVSHYSVHANSPSMGYNFKVTQKIAAYSNWSQSFTPQSQTAKATTHLPNETARGWDYGFKSSFFDDRLNFTLGGFYINRNGISVQQYDPDTGLTNTVAGGSQLSRGVELDGTWRVTDNFTVLGGYGHVNSIETNAGNDLDALGRPPAKVPTDNFGVAGKYNFTGALKGLSTNFGVTYVGQTHPANPTDGGLTNANPALGPVGVILANDGRRELITPGYYVVNFGIRYRLRTSGSKLNQTIGLNINNLLNHDYLTAGRQQGDSRAIYLSYSLGR